MSYAHFTDIFETFRYPAGESHLRIRSTAEIRTISVIEVRARNFDDLGQIVTADQLLRRSNVEVEWFVPYFPFARHDRRIDDADGFELGVALKMVEDLRIIVADPHSDVAGQLPQIPQEAAVELYRDNGVFDHDPIVVVPDAGAAKKTYEWLNGSDVVQSLKHRDPRTGKLSGFQILADDLGGRPCIIVDDICDGGGTFLGVAAELKKLNAGPLTLAITHGLFTKGTDHLLETFEQIVTFGPATPSDPAALKRISFNDLYEKGTRR